MKSKIRKILKSKVLKNSIWLTILQVVNTVIPVLTIPYITRVLGAEEYGTFSIALNWILYFQVLVEFGFGLNGARKVAILNDEKELNKLFNNIISSRIILFVISFLVLNIISFISRFDLKMYICMLILFTMIIGTTFQLTWLFQGKQDMKFITIVNAISRIISVILIFVFVKSQKHIYLYCLLYSITLLLSSIISLVIANKKYNLKFKFAKLNDIKNEINEGKYLFASAAMTKIFSGFGTTILGIFSTNYLVGVYSAIYKIPYILTMFFSPLSQALFPFCSAEFKKSFNAGKNKVKKLCTPIFLMFSLLSIFIIIFRNIIINILFGKEYLEFSMIIIPLVMQFLFAIINNFLGVQILVASGNQKEYSKAFAVGCLAIVLTNTMLGKKYDIYGVSIAAFVGELILTISLLISYTTIYRKEVKNEKN